MPADMCKEFKVASVRGDGGLFGFAWYQLRSTFRARRGGYIAIVLLVGLVGGLALASMAGARRTESSFPDFWASTHHSNLIGTTAVLNPLIGSDLGYNPAPIQAISRIPQVKRVASQPGIDLAPLLPNGAPLAAFASSGNGFGSLNGEFFTQDKVVVTSGRMANPSKVDEFMLSAQGSSILHIHVGQVVPIGVYTNDQIQLPGFGTPAVAPYRRFDMKMVGIAFFNTAVIEDETDMGSNPIDLFTPAFTRQFTSCCVNYTGTGVQVDSPGNVAAVNAAISKVLPQGFPAFEDTSVVVAKAQRSIRPEVIALWAFGGIVALATLLIAVQVIGRQLRLGAQEREVLRALGASPRLTLADGLVGIVASVAVGALLAAAVAVGLSPLAPLGPTRAVYPYGGVSFDWTILGLGMLTVVLVLSLLAWGIAYLNSPHRSAERDRRTPARSSRVVSVLGSAGLPPPAVTGMRFALESGSGQDAVPVRSAILGAVLAVIVVVGTVIFGASLNSLVSHPRLYGWNWDYALSAGGDGSDIPLGQVTGLLDKDRYVGQWSAVSFAPMQLDGNGVPVMSTRPGAAVEPPVLSGHGLEAADQIVLGASTLAELRKRTGDFVTLTSPVSKPVRLQIVGISTLPTIGGGGGPGHLEMATGAIVATSHIPPVYLNVFNNPVPGPNNIFVRLKPGVDRAAALASLNRIAQATSNTFNFGVAVETVQKPAEIVNYRTLGATPAFLGAGLAAGAIAALALTLIASVRRRRRDLALLKTLGFTNGQLAGAVAWQSTVAVVIGTAVGVPVGIALGRWLWDLFARSIHAVPAPDVPALSIVVVVIGALVLGNLVAALPGRIAARTQTALLLRSD